MEFMLYLIYYVSFAILSVVSLEVPSLRASESDLFTTFSHIEASFAYGIEVCATRLRLINGNTNKANLLLLCFS